MNQNNTGFWLFMILVAILGGAKAVGIVAGVMAAIFALSVIVILLRL